MRSLAVLQQGVQVAVDGGRISIEKDGETIQRVRFEDIEVVECFGSVSWTPAAVRALLHRNIDIVMLSLRGQYVGRVRGRFGGNAALRLCQYRAAVDPELRLPLVRAVVEAKISNQRNLLLRIQRREKREDLAQGLAELRHLRARVAEASALDVIRGLEGRAAAIYFPALGSAVKREEFRFEKRTRRPPKDPANAVLSFGYTILLSRMETYVLRASLDPMLGLLHDVEHGRASLALDLIEEFRPLVVDAMMLSLFNKRELLPDDFQDAKTHEDPLGEGSEDGGGVHLAESGRKIFFRAWSRRLGRLVSYEPLSKRFSMEEVMRMQVYAMARAIQDPQVPYVGFVPK